MKLHPRKLYEQAKRKWYRAKLKHLIRQYDFGGFKRIYHYHIRKTGGTSVAHMFMSLNGNNSQSIWNKLTANSGELCINNGLVYAGWFQTLLEQGDYFFGFSHLTFDEIQLPDNTFTFTCFRDPAERVISHYRMLQGMVARNSQHPCMATEANWLGNSFDDFLDRIPRDHLLNQLFMFSEQFSVAEALKRVTSLNRWMFTERFDDGVQSLNQATGLRLASTHRHRSDHRFDISHQATERLFSMLEEEYNFFNQLQPGIYQYELRRRSA